MNIIFLCVSLASATISLDLHSIYSSQEEANEKRFRRLSPSKRLLSVSSDITNYKNLQYYASFTFGTPAQTLTCLLDTGSTWIWVPQKGCTTCGSVDTYYDPSKSSTYHNTTILKKLTYLSGSSTGYLSTETIALEDGTKVTAQPFISVYAETDAAGFVPDGLVGLGFDALSDGYASLMTTLKSQGVISRRQFAIFLGDNDWGSSSESLSSNIMIDGYDLAKYSTVTEFQYISLADDTGYWEVDCDSVKADGYKISDSMTAIVDTGTSLIYGPTNDVYNFYYLLLDNYGCYSSNYGIVCDCNKINSLPDVTFRLDGIDFTITPDKYMWEETKGYCFVEISNADINFWLLGDIFIRQYYINYDMDGEKIGFAVKASGSSSSSSIDGWKIAVIVATIGGAAIIIIAILLIRYIKHRKFVEKSERGREVVVNATVNQPPAMVGYPNQPPQGMIGGQPMPGQPYQGQPYTAQPMSGQPYQGQPYPAQPMPGQPYQGQPYIAQSMPGQQMQYPALYPYQPAGPQGIPQNQQYGANSQPGLFQQVIAQPADPNMPHA